MKKVIFVDIDGTIRNNNKEITPETKEAIKNVVAKGTKVVICTGRSRDYAIEVSKEALASPYVIASDGAYVYDYHDKLDLYTNEINKTTLEEIYTIAKRYNVNITADTTTGQYTDNRLEKSPSVTYKENFLEYVLQEKIIHIHLTSKNGTDMQQALVDIKKVKNIKLGFDGVYQFQDNYFIFIANPNSNKGDGINNFCKALNIPLKETVGIGDDYNDIAMFKMVGKSVAMGNAYPDIKEICDCITDTNENNGVAKWLNSNF